MSKVLRLIGYWAGPAAPDGLPDVRDFVSAVDSAARQPVVAYLRSGAVFVAAAGVSTCRLCGAANGSAEQTDGEHFVWPEGLAHYVEAHGVSLPDEVVAVAVAARGVAPAVDLEWFTAAVLETGAVTIDDHWWSERAAPGSAGRAAAGSTPFATSHSHSPSSRDTISSRRRPGQGGRGASCSIRMAAPAAAHAAGDPVDGPPRRPSVVPGSAAIASTGGLRHRTSGVGTGASRIASTSTSMRA
jgi:hypothetical protein